MANVTLKKVPHEVKLATVLITRKDARGKTLVITDNSEISSYMESKGEDVLLLRSLGESDIARLYAKYKDYDRIIITSPKVISRYYKETVGVKVNKATEWSERFSSDVIILSSYSNSHTIVSNSATNDGVQINLSGRRITNKAKSLRRFK